MQTLPLFTIATNVEDVDTAKNVCRDRREAKMLTRPHRWRRSDVQIENGGGTSEGVCEER